VAGRPRRLPSCVVKRLYLLRHAKSSWKQTELADRDRPLAGRGRRAAKAIRRHLREQAIDPDLVLCSPARRTRETLERIEPSLGRGAVKVEPELYGASADELLERLRAVPDDVESVLLIGHNPGIADLTHHLCGFDEKFPTAALATLELPAWPTLDRAELVDFTRPRDLEG
jgi:phosphohistidine phosphatase